MTPTGTAGANFIDPKVLARIDNLELVARTVVSGFINGLHHSPYIGLSVDFAEHRAYMPGDDIRRIDWRLFARTDRFFVKEFEADTNSNFYVLLDVSRSMDFKTGDLSKLDYARYLAASLAYFSNQQRDRVGLYTFDNDLVDVVPCSARHLRQILFSLDNAKAKGPGELAAPLNKIVSSISRRSVIAIISDFYEDPATIVEAVNMLKYRGNDVIVFHILDPEELNLTIDEAASFEDLETGERIPVVPDEFRAEYKGLVQSHIDRLRKSFVEHGIDYSLFETSTPLDYALFRYLSERERLSRVS